MSNDLIMPIKNFWHNNEEGKLVKHFLLENAPNDTSKFKVSWTFLAYISISGELMFESIGGVTYFNFKIPFVGTKTIKYVFLPDLIIQFVLQLQVDYDEEWEDMLVNFTVYR